MKLAVEEPESEALVAALARRRPVVTSVVGDVETVRACRRANVPPEQVEELQDGMVVVALDDEIRRLAAAVQPLPLRALDAIHLATALTLGGDVEALVTYDLRLLAASQAAGLTVLSPS